MEMEEEEQKKTVPREIIKELDVIYIPFKTPIHTLQFPTQGKDNDDFDKYLQISYCDYKILQKKLDIHYKLKNKIDNFILKKDPYQQNKTAFQGTFQEEEEENVDITANTAVTYTSKLVANQTNYFASKYDKIQDKLLFYGVDSFLQMRPKIQEKELKKDKENISKSISKLSKDRERDELLRKKHPQKYIEMKLKNFNNFNEIYDSEETIRLNYHDRVDFQTDKSFRSFSEPVKELIKLNPVTKSEFQEQLESGGYNII